MAANKGYTPKGKLGAGSRFANVSGGVAQQYIKKGYSTKKAAAIGAAVAAKQGAAKFGQARMTKLAAQGKS